MSDWIKENKMYLLIGLVIVLALGVYYFVPLEKEPSERGLETEWMETENSRVEDDPEIETEVETNADVTQERIVIDVKGAVTTPGVYEASIGERVIDIIERAGGLLDSADQNNINFAMKVVDEMVLYIPAMGEQSQAIVGVAAGGSLQEGVAADGKVNLNTASESDLQTLPGIGPSKALAIIEYRETNGSYKSVEELMEISGIGEKTFEKLKEHITVQ